MTTNQVATHVLKLCRSDRKLADMSVANAVVCILVSRTNFFNCIYQNPLHDILVSHCTISSEMIEASLERPKKAAKSSNSEVATSFLDQFSPSRSPSAASSMVYFPDVVVYRFVASF